MSYSDSDSDSNSNSKLSTSMNDLVVTDNSQTISQLILSKKLNQKKKQYTSTTKNEIYGPSFSLSITLHENRQQTFNDRLIKESLVKSKVKNTQESTIKKINNVIPDVHSDFGVNTLMVLQTYVQDQTFNIRNATSFISSFQKIESCLPCYKNCFKKIEDSDPFPESFDNKSLVREEIFPFTEKCNAISKFYGQNFDSNSNISIIAHNLSLLFGLVLKSLSLRLNIVDACTLFGCLTRYFNLLDYICRSKMNPDGYKNIFF